MKEASPVIRPARREDADFLARALLLAARGTHDKGWFDIVLAGKDRTPLDFLRRLTLTSTRSWWHYSRFLIAEMDGAPAATLCGFRAGDAYPLSEQALIEAARGFGWSDAEQHEMWRRGTDIFTCTFDTSDDTWAIENIATVPEYRGRGLIRSLIEHSLAEGRLSGARQAQITFLIGNDAAERVYARIGFKFKDERRHPDFEAATGAPGLRRYLRDL